MTRPLTRVASMFAMRTLPDRFAARFLPKGWPDLLRQIVLFCGAYWLYRLVRGSDGRARRRAPSRTPAS